MMGMQKIKRGTGFRGVLEYAMEAGRGRIIGGNMVGSNPRELAAEFSQSRKIREDIEKPVWHQSLRLPAGERLDVETWRQLADDYMARLGFTEFHQRAYVLHDDPEGQHIHIIASRVGLAGAGLYLGQNENLKSSAHIRELERAYGLQVFSMEPADLDHRRRGITSGEKGLAERTGEVPVRVRLQALIDEAVMDKPAFADFVRWLEAADVSVLPSGKTGQPQGISFALSGIAMKGSDLGKSYAWKALRGRIDYQPERDQIEIDRLRQPAQANQPEARDGQDQRNEGSGPDRGPRQDRDAAGIGGGYRPDGGGHGRPGRGIAWSDGEGPGGGDADRPGFQGHGRDRGLPADLETAGTPAPRDPKGPGVADAAGGRADGGDPGAVRLVARGLSDLAAPVRPTEAGAVDVPDAAASLALAASDGRTTRAVKRQLMAMDCDGYELGIRDSASGKMLLQTKTPAQVVAAIPWLRRMNARRHDIYIRPAPDARTGLVLVDDLGDEDLERMREQGHDPAVVVQTSPKNYQAWVRLGDDLPREVRTEAARYFVRAHGADPNSADWRHLGRLAGFTNRKADHTTVTGQPWCLLTYAKDREPGFIAPAADAILGTVYALLDDRNSREKEALFPREALATMPEPMAEYDEVARWYRYCAEQAPNPSKADWFLSVLLFERGFGYQTVLALVREYSPGLKTRKVGHIDDYIERTVAKAEVWSEFKAEGKDYSEVRDIVLAIAKNRMETRKNRNHDEYSEVTATLIT